MKKLLLFLILGCSAALRAQTVLQLPVSFRVEEQSLEAALYELSEQADVSLSFTNELIPPVLVSLALDSVPLDKALDQLLLGTPLQYRLLGTQVVVYLPDDAQYTISGILEDQRSGERLINANVLDRRSGRGTTTNEYGYYSLTMPAGPAELYFSYVGYAAKEQDFYLLENRRMDISLQSDLTLQPVEVIGSRTLAEQKLVTADGGVQLSNSQVEALPPLAGEPDLLRAIHLLPGLQTGTDGIGGLHVRGGNNGQNLILMDGVPIYNVSHAAGLFSVFNTNAIRSATLYKGGFPARYSGRLSSILDIRTKEGNEKEYHAQSDLGLLSSRLTVEGPIVREKSSFILSGRRSLLGWYLQPLAENLRGEDTETTRLDYDFYDVNAKFNVELSGRDNLYLSYYQGFDQYEDRGVRTDTLAINTTGQPDFFRTEEIYDNEISWGNRAASLRWTHLFGDRLFGSLSATFSSLDIDISYLEADSVTELRTGDLTDRIVTVGRYESQIRDVGLQLDFDYRPSPSYQLLFGGRAVRHQFEPGLLAVTLLEKGGPNFHLPELQRRRYHSVESGLYMEHLLHLGDDFHLNAGLHAAAFWLPERTYWSWQPRLMARWKWSSRWEARAHYSRMEQFAHQLFNTVVGLPTEIWVPSTADIAPERSWQTGLGLSWEVAKGWQLTSDWYYKQLDQLLTFIEGATLLNDWEANTTTGSGRAYGMELLLEKQKGATRGWAGYTLSRAERQFDRINNGTPYPYRFDRRHDFKLGFAHRFNDWLQLSGAYVFSTGFRFTLPQGEYNIELPGVGLVNVVEYSDRNAFLMPNYHRLDLSLNIFFQATDVSHALQIGVYNLYNRRNPLFYDIESSFVVEGNEISQEKQFESVWLLPLLPSLNYTVKF